MAMKDFQPRLSELISPQDIRCKRRGSLYILNNSLKRNTLNSFAPLRSEEIGYDCKLPHMSLKRRELAKMLELILSKEEKNLPDRNFLRRVLVETFDEDLIHSGSRNFINHLNLLKQKADDTVVPAERLFYFILKGAATVRSGGFVYAVREGSTFGEKELLSGLQIQQILYTEPTLMVTLSQINFDNYFRYYFQKNYHDKIMQVQCIREKYLLEVPLINQFFFLDQIAYETFNPGDKIVEKGRAVDRVYFVGEGWKGDRLASFKDGCFGLKEVMKSQEAYMESAFCLELGYRVAFVEKDIFVKYVKDFLMMVGSGLVGRCSIRTTGMAANPEEKEAVLRKMNMKKVRIQSKVRKMATQPLETIVSQFKFFSNCEVQPMTSPKYHKMLRDISKDKKGNSLSVNLKPNRKIIL